MYFRAWSLKNDPYRVAPCCFYGLSLRCYPTRRCFSVKELCSVTHKYTDTINGKNHAICSKWLQAQRSACFSLCYQPPSHTFTLSNMVRSSDVVLILVSFPLNIPSTLQPYMLNRSPSCSLQPQQPSLQDVAAIFSLTFCWRCTSTLTLQLSAKSHNPDHRLGFFPGCIHAFWLIYRKMQAEERYGNGGFICEFRSLKISGPSGGLPFTLRHWKWPLSAPIPEPSSHTGSLLWSY